MLWMLVNFIPFLFGYDMCFSYQCLLKNTTIVTCLVQNINVNVVKPSLRSKKNSHDYIIMMSSLSWFQHQTHCWRLMLHAVKVSYMIWKAMLSSYFVLALEFSRHGMPLNHKENLDHITIFYPHPWNSFK